MDSANLFEVCVRPDGRIVILAFDKASPIKRLLTPEEAINLAAWLVAMADPSVQRFHRVLAEITTT